MEYEPFKDHEEEEVYDYDDEILDVKAMNFSIEESETEEISQPEAVQVDSSLFNAWILSTGKNVSQVLENYRSTGADNADEIEAILSDHEGHLKMLAVIDLPMPTYDIMVMTLAVRLQLCCNAVML